MDHFKKIRRLLSDIAILRSAIFTDYSLADLKFPTSVINVLKVEDDGTLWFILKRPFTQLDGLSKSFYGRLNLFNKCCPFYIVAEGTVHIHSVRVDPYKCSVPYEIEQLIKSSTEVAVCMHVTDATRFSITKEPKNVLSSLVGFLLA